MLNNQTGNAVSTECARLKRDLTQRGVRRFMARIFASRQDLEIVFDLKGGDSPKKSVFERMASHAETAMTRALEEAHYFTIIEKKRSPKNGTVTYSIEHKLDSTAESYQLRRMLSELASLADACGAVDTHGIALFQA